MEWLDDLEKDAWNAIIEELLWHLRQGRTPSALARTHSPDCGVEFWFAHTPTVFLPLTADSLTAHWQHATEAIARFRQLDAVRFRC